MGFVSENEIEFQRFKFSVAVSVFSLVAQCYTKFFHRVYYVSSLSLGSQSFTQSFTEFFDLDCVERVSQSVSLDWQVDEAFFTADSQIFNYKIKIKL